MLNPTEIDGRRSRVSMVATLIGMSLTVFNSPLLAQQYTWSTGPQSVTSTPEAPLPPVPRRTFLDVYCVDFPNDMPVDSVSEGFLNGNAISFYRVVYQTGMMGYVVTSTLPKGRSDAEDYALLLAQERRNEQAVNAVSTKDRYRVSTGRAAWGPVINVRIINILDKNAHGPFPLTRPILDHADGPPHSLSVHRLFTRGTNRFEIAVMGVPKDPKAKDSQRMLEKKLAALAEKLVASLQTCTTQMSSSDGLGRMPR